MKIEQEYQCPLCASKRTMFWDSETSPIKTPPRRCDFPLFLICDVDGCPERMKPIPEQMVGPSTLRELIECYFDYRAEAAREGREWNPRKETIYLTEQTYDTIVNDEAFSVAGGPDLMLLVRPKAKTFWGMKVKVI